MLLQEGNNGWPQVIDIDFEDNSTTAKPFERSIPIQESGMYYLWFVHCDEDLSAATVAGQTVWKNPGGYLPGMMFPHISFFAIMSLAYLVLMVVWGLLYARHWTDIFMLQHFMTAVIIMGMLEMSAWYFDYANFNVVGRRPVLPTLWAVIMGCLRKTVARTLIIMVSMGYGMVLPFLSDVQKKVSRRLLHCKWLSKIMALLTIACLHHVLLGCIFDCLTLPGKPWVNVHKHVCHN